MTILAAFLTVTPVVALENGLALTPPMGWRSWMIFKSWPNQLEFNKIFLGLVSRNRSVDGTPISMLELGYSDVGLDNGWQNCSGDKYVYHDNDGNPMVRHDRFPDMNNLTATAHAYGLTMGWYGNNCMQPEKEAPLKMYQGDVNATIAYGWDGIKLDGCGAEYDLDLFSRLFNATGKAIMIENCHWGKTVPNATWCPWNYYRTSGDMSVGYGNVVGNALSITQWAQKGLSKPGCWAYADNLVNGIKPYNGPALTFDESRTHFGLWCIMSSPLILSLDVSNATIMDEHWPIISNTLAIAVNQAWAGYSGSPYNESTRTIDISKWKRNIPEWQHLYKPVAENCVAVMLVNHDNVTHSNELYFNDVPGLECDESHGCWVVDVWSRTSIGWMTGQFQANIAGHDSVFLALASNKGACPSVFARPTGNTSTTWTTTSSLSTSTTVATSTTTTSTLDCLQYDTQYDSSLPGNSNLEEGPRRHVTNALACQEICHSTAGCVCFTWNGHDQCWLMTSCVTPHLNWKGFVAGNATCDGGAGTPTARGNMFIFA